MAEQKMDGPAEEATQAETRSPEQIEAEIERTREELGETVAALAEKTDVKDQAPGEGGRNQGEGEPNGRSCDPGGQGGCRRGRPRKPAPVIAAVAGVPTPLASGVVRRRRRSRPDQTVRRSSVIENESRGRGPGNGRGVERSAQTTAPRRGRSEREVPRKSSPCARTTSRRGPRTDGAVATLKRALEFSEDNMTDWAAALTYYGLLSLFPALIALVSIVGLFGDPQATTRDGHRHRHPDRPELRRRHLLGPDRDRSPQPCGLRDPASSSDLPSRSGRPRVTSAPSSAPRTSSGRRPRAGRSSSSGRCRSWSRW